MQASKGWESDGESDFCSKCNEKFSFYNRKHHCRACGKLLCNSCSPKFLLIPQGRLKGSSKGSLNANIFVSTTDSMFTTPQRCCKVCAIQLEPMQKELRVLNSRANTELNCDRDNPNRYMNVPISRKFETDIKKATFTLYNYCSDNKIQGEDKIPKELLVGAHGIVFITIIKAGFLFSGRMGTGLVVARTEDGQWSAPSAVMVTGMGWGFQAGGELTDVILILTTSAAVQAFSSKAQVSVGTELAVSLGPVGRSAGTDLHAGKKGASAAFSYAHSKGLFAGVSLEASVFAARPDINHKFYGHEVSPSELLRGGYPRPRAAHALYEALDDISSSHSKPSSGSAILEKYRTDSKEFQWDTHSDGDGSRSSRNSRKSCGRKDASDSTYGEVPSWVPKDKLSGPCSDPYSDPYAQDISFFHHEAHDPLSSSYTTREKERERESEADGDHKHAIGRQGGERGGRFIAHIKDPHPLDSYPNSDIDSASSPIDPTSRDGSPLEWTRQSSVLEPPATLRITSFSTHTSPKIRQQAQGPRPTVSDSYTHNRSFSNKSHTAMGAVGSGIIYFDESKGAVSESRGAERRSREFSGDHAADRGSLTEFPRPRVNSDDEADEGDGRGAEEEVEEVEIDDASPLHLHTVRLDDDRPMETSPSDRSDSGSDSDNGNDISHGSSNGTDNDNDTDNSADVKNEFDATEDLRWLNDQRGDDKNGNIDILSQAQSTLSTWDEVIEI